MYDNTSELKQKANCFALVSALIFYFLFQSVVAWRQDIGTGNLKIDHSANEAFQGQWKQRGNCDKLVSIPAGHLVLALLS